MTDNVKSLIAQRVRFYSERDEEHFFTWAHQIDGVISVTGQGDSIVLDCDARRMSEQSLRELIALFYRYKVDTEQLDVFLTDENRSWFMDKKAFWRA